MYSFVWVFSSSLSGLWHYVDTAGVLIVKVFRYKQFETKSVEAAFRARVRKEGILRRRDLETLEVSPVFMRPFRRVLWTLMNDSGRYSSFVDENIVSAVSDPDESLLLWRPNYAGLPTGEESDDHITLGDVVRQTVLERNRK
jgi:hypothetical protein